MARTLLNYLTAGVLGLYTAIAPLSFSDDVKPKTSETSIEDVVKKYSYTPEIYNRAWPVDIFLLPKAKTEDSATFTWHYSALMGNKGTITCDNKNESFYWLNNKISFLQTTIIQERQKRLTSPLNPENWFKYQSAPVYVEASFEQTSGIFNFGFTKNFPLTWQVNEEKFARLVKSQKFPERSYLPLDVKETCAYILHNKPLTVEPGEQQAFTFGSTTPSALSAPIDPKTKIPFTTTYTGETKDVDERIAKVNKLLPDHKYTTLIPLFPNPSNKEENGRIINFKVKSSEDQDVVAGVQIVVRRGDCYGSGTFCSIFELIKK